jgi:hypothetical protein
MSIERQARLKQESADQYPTIPVHRWTSAHALAQLVASDTPQPEEMRTGRALVDADFEFRGGQRRWFTGWIARTRTEDHRSAAREKVM